MSLDDLIELVDPADTIPVGASDLDVLEHSCVHLPSIQVHSCPRPPQRRSPTVTDRNSQYKRSNHGTEGALAGLIRELDVDEVLVQADPDGIVTEPRWARPSMLSNTRPASSTRTPDPTPTDPGRRPS